MGDWFPTPLPQRNLFRDEAQILSHLGLATFRYDKRGCGQSEGDFNTAGLFDLVDDAFWAWQWLQSLVEGAFGQATLHICRQGKMSSANFTRSARSQYASTRG